MNRRDALKALAGLSVVPSVSVAQLQPSDIVVLEYPRRLSQRQVESIRESFKKAFGERKVIVLEDGMKMTYVKQ